MFGQCVDNPLIVGKHIRVDSESWQLEMNEFIVTIHNSWIKATIAHGSTVANNSHKVVSISLFDKHRPATVTLIRRQLFLFEKSEFKLKRINSYLTGVFGMEKIRISGAQLCLVQRKAYAVRVRSNRYSNLSQHVRTEPSRF